MRVFDFGANWQEFTAERVDEQRLGIAEQSLRTLLDRPHLEGQTVLDVGCGSGLFAVAAARLGAERVVGIDINPRSIAASEQNHARFAPAASISFTQASALDAGRMAMLGQFDIVYAWGSLHHTGAMQDAIRNTIQCVAPGGTLVLAIYNQHATSGIWKRIKWFYNQVPALIQRLLVLVFAFVIFVAKLIVTRRNPLEKERGMDFWYDVIDWVGGYPYEYATPSAMTTLIEAQGYRLQKLVPAQVPTGCNEFVFTRINTQSAILPTLSSEEQHD
jgi:2-polyprenyl-6-hydroxyphenyl methylase/3-demethylubiquinone-9 3-methyltransferase